MTTRAKLAPMQFLAIGFDNLQFDRSIWEAIARLEDHRLIRVIDAVAIARTLDDDLVSIEIGDMPEGTSKAYGSIIRRLLGLELSNFSGEFEIALGDAMMVDTEYEYGITADEFVSILDDIPRQGGMAAMLIEHLWALPVKQAVRDSGGIVLAQDFINPEMLVDVAERLLRPAA
jgi:hypothetical protein